MPQDNFDVVTTKEKIEQKISKLEEARNEILDRSQDKAQAISEYDKAIAITILKLKNNAIATWEGQDIKSLPATLIIPVAKGLCFKECFNREANESGYKACITIIEAIKSELNGLQSINKFHD